MFHPLFFIVVLLSAGLTAYFAKQRGRRPDIWFVVGLLLGIWGVLLVLLLPPVRRDEEGKQAVSPSDDPQVIEVEGELVDTVEAKFRDKDWFYLDSASLQQGPVTFGYLRSLWKSGKLNRSTAVWYDGLKEWQTVASVDGLQEALEA